MTEDDSDYVQTYAEMADEELLGLARESASLVDAAQTALQAELDRRGLKPDPVKTSGGEAPTTLYCSGCERSVIDPLTCGSCSASICRVCGTPLEVSWDAENDADTEQLADHIKTGEQPAR